MKKRIWAMLLSISILSCVGNIPLAFSEDMAAEPAAAAPAAETIVYTEDFENTPIGSLPDNVTADVGADLGNAGYLAVAADAASGGQVLESRHQTTISGTNKLMVAVPKPITGGFVLDVDVIFGDLTIEKELALLTPSGAQLFAVGLQRSGDGYIGRGKRLYYELGSGSSTEIKEFDFDLSAGQKCHFRFEVDVIASTLTLTMDALPPITYDLTETGIAQEALGIGTVQMSTRYTRKVSGAGMYMAIDNIVLCDKKVEITNLKPDLYQLLPDVYLSTGGTAETDLSVYFYDPEDQPLTLTATDGGIDDQGVWTYTALEAGIFPVTITAQDPEGLTFDDTFNVIVNDGTGKDSLIYYEDFETTPINKVPSNVNLSVAAAFADGGGISVVKDGDNQVLRNNHRVVQSGTNYATFIIPRPGFGDFVMETDVRFANAVIRSELSIYTPEGMLMMTVGLGLGSNPNSAAPAALEDSKKLYYSVGGTKTLIDDCKPDAEAFCHLKFTFDASGAMMNLTVDDRAPIPVSLEDCGIAPDKYGIGSIRLSSYYNNAVGSNRYVTMDNIAVRADFEVSAEDQEIVKKDAQEMTWEYLSSEEIDCVTKSLNLRTEGVYGSTISWASSDESVLSANGMVLPQEETKTITLIATFQKGAASTQRIYKVTVLPKEQPVYGDWYFEDFESYPAGESIIGQPGWSGSTTPPTNADTDMTCVPDPSGADNQMLKGNCNHTGIQNYSGYSGFYDFEQVFDGDFEISFDFMVGQVNTDSRVGVFNSSGELLFEVEVSSTGAFAYIVNGKTTTISRIKPTANTLYHFRLVVSASTRYVAWYIDEKLAATLRQTENVAQNYDVSRLRFYLWVRKTGVGSMYIDNLRVRENLTAKLSRYFEDINFDSYADGVDADFPLPQQTADGTEIIWTSNDEAIVPDEGVARVFRPAADAADVEVILTATVSEGAATESRDYVIKVLRSYTDGEAVEKDAAALLWNRMSPDPEDAVLSPVTLPKAGNQGTEISWTVSGDALVLTDGLATPVRGSVDQPVTLTAAVTRGGHTATKEFDLVVLRNLPVNLAENRKAAEQSTQIASMPVSYAFDNNFSTVWSTLYADDAPYVILDLGAKQPVDSLMISERSKNISSLCVTASNDKLHYQDVYRFDKTAYLDKTETDIHSFDMVEARYFKITFTRCRADEELLINEIQLYFSQLTDAQAVQLAAQVFDIYHKNSVTENLVLPSAGSHGTTLTYQSSDESILSSDGRVTRPDDTATVQLTVTFSKGAERAVKQLAVTVIGNRALAIPDNTDYKPFDDVYTPMSNEEFFGVWDGTRNVWSIDNPGVFNYNVNPEMQKIGEYVKRGDYETARSALVLYYKTRDIGYDSVQTNTSYEEADVYINNILAGGGHSFIASTQVPSDWGEVTADVSATVKKPGTVAMFIMQKYKHESEAEFYSKEAGEHAAELEIEYNGKRKTYPVVADTYVSPDTNIRKSYGSEKRLYVKETTAAHPEDVAGGYGNLWTSNTKRTYLKFNIDDLDDNTNITSATLKLYGRAPGGAEVLIWREGLTGWDENTYNWEETLNDVYSWNGGKVDWVYPSDKALGGVTAQLPRFYASSTICGAYGSTGDEYYAYHSIRQILDFIEGTKDYVGYGNLQASGIRGSSFIISFNQLLQSKHMTDDAAITMIQYLWLLTQTMSQETYFRADHNHGIYANRGLMRLTMFFTEFSKHPQWKQLFIDRYNILLNTLISADGAYREATTHYTSEVARLLLTALDESKASNFELDPFFNKKLKDLTMYLGHTLSPAGTNAAYGDADHGANHKSVIKNIAEALDDDELRYLYSNGTKGEYPGFTSKLYPQGRYLVMRDGYDDDAWIMQTNWGIGDGRSHTHPDNLSLTLYAHGKYLVADPGRFNYTDNIYSNWLRNTTQAHNVVNINETNQGLTSDTANLFVTNDGFDYFTATSRATKDANAKPYNYQRSVLFSKSNFFVVSDKVTPDAANTAVNKYDQNWHFLPDSNIRYTADTGMLRTNFESGSQLIIAQADPEELDFAAEDKYFSLTSHSVSDAEYARFTQETAGTVSFDTVLYPIEGGDKTKVTADRISLDVPKETATALNITVDDTVNAYQNIYYKTYEETPAVRSIGGLAYDGEALLVEYAATGKISSISMVGGSRLTDGDAVVVRAKNTVDDLFVNYNWDEIVIQSSSLNEETLAGLELASQRDVTAVILNGKPVSFHQTGNLVTVGSAVSTGEDRIEVTQDGERMVGTVGTDYESVLRYGYNGKTYPVTLSIAADTKISGNADWDGTMPKLRTGTTTQTIDGAVVQVIVFDNRDLTFDTPYAVQIDQASGILLYQQGYKKLSSASIDAVKKELKPGQVGMHSTEGKVTLFADRPIEMILYKQQLSPPSLPSTVPSGGGSGGSGGTSTPIPPATGDTGDGTQTPDETKPPVFQDIQGHWAKAEIEQMAEIGIAKGDNGSFYPDNNITRAEFTALLVRLLGYEKESDPALFADVSENDWFAGEVQAAYQHGLVAGSDGMFRPNDPITREETAVILARVMEMPADANVLDGYQDKNEVSAWAVDAMAEAIQSGLISGMDAETLAPKALTTRAMAITMLARMYRTALQ